MKKFFLFLFIIVLLGCGGYFVYVNYINKVPKIVLEEEVGSINEYFIYGNHFNIKGDIDIENKDYEKLYLTLYNGEDRDIDIVSSSDGGKVSYYISELINEGLYIDDLEVGKYYLFLKAVYSGEDDSDEKIVKYYSIRNDTEYKEIEYDTLSKFNNVIYIDSNNEYNTLAFNVKKSDVKNYDVTIDPGHGGMDGGGSYGDYKETDFTMDISKMIKSYLEDNGITVMLTHDEGDIDSNSVMDEYNKNGRAVIPNEVKSKYTFSIHINKNASTRVRGIEIYTPSGINYDLANDIVDNIVSNTSLGVSSNRLYKVYDGVYTHNFTESEIRSSLDGYEKKGYKAYNVTSRSNYLYMIRETGGFMTGAYVDDSNPDKVGVNPYFNSNMGNEAYLLEIGYISNSGDVDILLNEKESIAKSIATAIVKEIKEKV